MLRPDAPVLMLWNVWDTSVQWLAQLDRFRRSYDADRSSSVATDVIVEWFDRTGWTAIERCDAAHMHRIPSRRLAELMLTSSVFAGGDGRVEAALRTEVDAVAKEHGLYDDETLHMPYRTLAFWTRRR